MQSARLPSLVVGLTLGCAPVAASAQSPAHFDDQVARGVSALAQTRIKRPGLFEWMKERIEIDNVREGVVHEGKGREPVGVFSARVRVSQSRKVPEAQVHADDLPLRVVMRVEVEMRFLADADYGKWAFDSGRYWVLDSDGRRASEITMFPRLLTDAPSDAPHALAWAIMAP